MVRSVFTRKSEYPSSESETSTGMTRKSHVRLGKLVDRKDSIAAVLLFFYFFIFFFIEY